MTYKSIFIRLFIAIFACVSVSFIRADDITITTCDFASLQSAITEANGLDEAVIQLDCEGIIPFARQISITGDVHLIGNEALLFDGDGRTRLFYVADGASLTLENMTIQNGYASEYGGALLNDNGTLTINKVLFIGNTAQFGGVIYNFGALTITDSHFMWNSGDLGGVIYNDEADATLTNTYFYENHGFYGAVVYNDEGNVTLIRAKLLENKIDSRGALLFNSVGAMTDIRASDIYGMSNYINITNNQGIFVSQDTHYENVGCIQGAIFDNGGNISEYSDDCPGDAPTTPTDVIVTDCDHFWGSGTVLEAVIIANRGGGTITFACSGTIHFLHELTIMGNVTINGGGNIIFDGDGKTGLVRTGYDDSTVDFDGLTFQNGIIFSLYASAIDSYGDVTISNCTFINNERAVEHTGTLTIHNSVFTDNRNGAVSVDGDFTMTDSTFTNNSRRYGGAISLDYTNEMYSSSITNSTFTNNSAEANGGAIAMFRNVHLTITDSTFTGNTAGEYGGAIFTRGAFTTIQNSTFTDNTAGITGGAFFHEVDKFVDGAVSSENSVYVNNSCVSEVSINERGGNVAENAAGCPNS
jgi:predicted outer membrane repeat protein